MTIIFLQQEEQQRLQRLQQAQRDAFASEVLKEFDLGQLNEIKDGFDQEDEDQKDDIKLETKNEIVEDEEEDALAKQRAALEAIKQRAALGKVSLKMSIVTIFGHEILVMKTICAKKWPSPPAHHL